jgi:hypothetical protein
MCRVFQKETDKRLYETRRGGKAARDAGDLIAHGGN